MLWQENIHPGISPPLFGTDYGGRARSFRVRCIGKLRETVGRKATGLRRSQ